MRTSEWNLTFVFNMNLCNYQHRPIKETGSTHRASIIVGIEYL